MSIPIDPNKTELDNLKELLKDSAIIVMDNDTIGGVKKIKDITVNIDTIDERIEQDTSVDITTSDKKITFEYRRINVSDYFAYKTKGLSLFNPDNEIEVDFELTEDNIFRYINDKAPLIKLSFIEEGIPDTNLYKYTLDAREDSYLYTGRCTLNFKRVVSNPIGLWEVPKKTDIDSIISLVKKEIEKTSNEFRELLNLVPLIASENVAVLTDSKWGITPDNNITQALLKALTDPKIKTVYIPRGTYSINHLSLGKVQNKVLIGDGTDTIINYIPGPSLSVINIPFESEVKNTTFTNFTLDGKWTNGNTPANAFQINSGTNIKFYKLKITNIGGNGIISQGSELGNDGSSISVVECDFDNVVLDELTGGSAILVEDNSPYSLICNNRINNLAYGNAIFVNSTNLGNPTNVKIFNNTITYSETNSSVDGISINTNVDNVVIYENYIKNATGSGIVSYGNSSILLRNYLENIYKDGIDISGKGHVVSSNYGENIGIRNIKHSENKSYSAITLDNVEKNYIGYNTFKDGSIAHAIKFVNVNKGSNYIGNNTITGYSNTYLSKAKHDSDIVNGEMIDLNYTLPTKEEVIKTDENAGPTD